jgi:hypothetical protein
VELAVKLEGNSLKHLLAVVFFLVSVTFVYRSFFAMRIGSAE